MNEKHEITIRTATRDREAKILVPLDATIKEILASAIINWKLSENYEYIIRSERRGVQLSENTTILDAEIIEGDVLEIQPLADAG